MIRKISLVLVIGMLVSILSGCSSDDGTISDNTVFVAKSENTNLLTVEPNNVYDAKICGFSDSASSVFHQKEYEFADREKYDSIIPKDKLELTINGEKRECEYQQTYYSGFNFFPTYRYEDIEKNMYCVDDTGILVSYYDISVSNNVFDTKKKISPKESLSIAKNFLAQMVDPSVYKTEITDEADSGYYHVEFNKYIGDYQTTDSASVYVTYSGDIYMYSAFMLGRIPNDIAVDDIDRDAILASVAYKLDEIYKDAKTKYDKVEYEKPSILLTILKNGKRGVVCYADVNFITYSEEYTHIISEKNKMVLFVE